MPDEQEPAAENSEIDPSIRSSSDSSTIPTLGKNDSKTHYSSISSERVTKDSVSTSVVTGSAACPYKLAIVGAGPAGCAVLVRALRLGLADELCGYTYESKEDYNADNVDRPTTPIVSNPEPTSAEKHQQQEKISKNAFSDAKIISAGVCLIDRDSPDRLGGGRLQDYSINSNTYANKFVSNVIDDKLESIPVEKASETILAEKLHQSSCAQQLLEKGSKQGPLNVIGGFLREVGSTVKELLETNYAKSSRVLTNTQVVSIHRCVDNKDGSEIAYWKLTVMDNSSINNSRGPLRVAAKMLGNGGSTRVLYANHVVLATGGSQKVPRLPNTSHNSKLLSSDFVCTDAGIDEVRSRIERTGRAKVAIVGGSHSAFSAAWMCLNRLNPTTMLSSSLPIANEVSYSRKMMPSAVSGSSKGSIGVANETSALSRESSKLAIVTSASPTTIMESSVVNSGLLVSVEKDPKTFSPITTVPVVEFSAVTTIEQDGRGESPAINIHSTSSINENLSFHNNNNERLPSPLRCTTPSKIAGCPSSIRSFTDQLSKVGSAECLNGVTPAQSLLQKSPKPRRIASFGTGRSIVTPTKRPHTVCSNSSSSGRKGRSGSIENLLPKASLLDLCPNSITIIHKSYVKVFYGTKQDADADKYFDYCGGPIPVNKLTGQLHPFGGIRGDAKALWKQIRFGMEPRVRLQQIKYNVAVIGRNEIPSVKPAAGGASAAIKQTIVDKLFDDAAVIVWACGYNSNLVPIFDVDGKTIPVRQYRGQVDVDEEGQLHTEDDFKLYSTKVDCPDRSQKQDRVPEVQKVGTDDKQVQTPTKPLIQRDIASSQLLVGLYGSGLGYGPRIYLENGQPDGSSGRADGVAVYLKKGASLVLAKVLGTDKVFGPNIKSWEDRNMLLNRMAADAASATVALKKKNVMAELEQSVPAVTTLSPKKQKI